MTVPRGYVGHPREAHQCWPDPKIRHGAFRVLPRTDGRFIVFDDVTKVQASLEVYADCEAAGYAASQMHFRDRRPEALEFAEHES